MKNKFLLLAFAMLAIGIDEIDAQISPSYSCKDMNPDDLYWDNTLGPSGLGGNDCIVYSSAVDGQELYIGGTFLYAGEKTVNHIARWNGTIWEALGTGLDGQVMAIANKDGNVYVGGCFTTAGGVPANNIAKWDGSQWQPLGEGITGVPLYSNPVNALAFIGDKLYVGGDFTTAGSIAVSNLACWNVNHWEDVGGGVSDVVRSMSVNGNDIFVGGDFGWVGPVIGGLWAYHVARFDGTSWFPLGSGMDGDVYALECHGSDLYAGGNFITSGGLITNYVARWDGSQWNALANGVLPMSENSPVNDFTFIGDTLYMVGNFDISGGPFDLIDIAKWNGTSWLDCGYGLYGYQFYTTAYTVSSVGNDIYCGGYFTGSGSTKMRSFGKWDGSQWTATGTGFGNGMDSFVNTLLVSGNDLWVGGMFQNAGDTPVSYIAKWDGSQWSEPDRGTSYEVKALMTLGPDLYVAGGFTYVGNQVPVGGIARWDGSSWHALGQGFSSTVYAMTHIGTDIYVGRSGAVINKWDGNQWTLIATLGGTVEGVKALAVIGNDLYAGGTFTDVNDVPANYIAKWNGTEWSALGTGMNQQVRSLCVIGNDLYAGGWFTTAGGNEAKYLARWDGNQWYPVGGGMNDIVSGLANIDGQLYVGGKFTMAGATPVNKMALWDGDSWATFGSGTSSDVLSFTKMGDDLYVGGYFETAGNKSSAFIGKWLKYPNGNTENNVVKNRISVYPNPTNGVVHFRMLPGNQRISLLEITDLFGRVVSEAQVETKTKCEFEINLSELPPGIYLTRIGIEDQLITRKIIKL